MRSTTLWARLLGLVKAVVEDVAFDEDDECVVVSVRPRKATKRRCGRCGRGCPGYDQGEGRRRWRALDLGTIRASGTAHPETTSSPRQSVVPRNDGDGLINRRVSRDRWLHVAARPVVGWTELARTFGRGLHVVRDGHQQDARLSAIAESVPGGELRSWPGPVPTSGRSCV